MSKLKNTPWRANNINSWPYWNVYDSQGKLLTDIPEPTARAIAALPETIDKLERLGTRLKLIDRYAHEIMMDNDEFRDSDEYINASKIRHQIKKALKE